MPPPPVKKRRTESTGEFMEESTTSLNGESDVCQQVLDHYSKSMLPQHLHLCATAVSIRSIVESKFRSLTPLNYYAATIDVLSKTTNDPDAVSALSLFLAIVLPLVPENSIHISKAAKGVEIVTKLVDESLQVSRVMALLQSLEVLLKSCKFDDWELGFQTLIKYAVDKRLMVRVCAQECALKVFKAFQTPLVKDSASKLVLNSFKTYMALAVTTTDGYEVDEVSECEDLEVLHMFDLLRLLSPCLPSKVMTKAIVELQNSLSAKFSPLRSHVLDFMKEMLRFFESESEVTLLDKVKIVNKWRFHYSSVIGCIAGLLMTSEATRASEILKEVIDRVDFFEHVVSEESKESRFVKSFSDSLLEALGTDTGTPNEHSLAVISDLFSELGSLSHTHMGRILVKLANFMTVRSVNTCDVKHVRECIGSAIVFMGPDKALSLLPISCDSGDLKFSNTWLLPILKDYTCTSYLQFFIDSIVPLAASFEEACQKVEKKRPVLRDQLHSYARGCWELLPAFCRQPVDMHESYGKLAKLLIPHIQKEAYMLEDIAIALQHLVKDNKNWRQLDDVKSNEEARKLPWRFYNKKIATTNIKALSSCSDELLMAFTQVFFQVSPKERAFIKDTIGCLALVTEYSAIKAVLISIKLNVSMEDIRVRCLLIELASSLPPDVIYDFLKDCLQEEDADIQRESYAFLCKLLVSSEFKSSKLEKIIDLLLNLKPPLDITSVRHRFSCFKTLLLLLFEATHNGDNMYSSGMLSEIILTLEDPNEESRLVALDILSETSSSILQIEASSSKRKGPYHDFISMIMGHLGGPSRLKSGAVLALSSLLSNDSTICQFMPNLVPEVLYLLESKVDIEVIIACFGFIEVLVLNLEVRDLQKFLPDILSGLLSWSSSAGQDDFKSKVIAILESMMGKCGWASVISLVHEDYRDFVNSVFEVTKQSPIEEEEEEEEEESYWM